MPVRIDECAFLVTGACRDVKQFSGVAKIRRRPPSRCAPPWPIASMFPEQARRQLCPILYPLPTWKPCLLLRVAQFEHGVKIGRASCRERGEISVVAA